MQASIEERAVFKVRRDGVEPPRSIRTTGLQPAGPANAQPTHIAVRVARVGVEPTNNHEGLSFAALPVCVPCLCTFGGQEQLDS